MREAQRRYHILQRNIVNFCIIIIIIIIIIIGLDSAVGIATRYGLDGQGVRIRDFPRLFRPALGLTQPPIQWVPGLTRS
jgi:hypothetical protein